MALFPIEIADMETVGLSTDPRFIATNERSRVLCKPGSGSPLAEIRRKYGLERKPARKPTAPSRRPIKGKRASRRGSTAARWAP